MTTKDEIKLLSKGILYGTYNRIGILLNIIGAIFFYIVMIASIIPSLIYFGLKRLFKRLLILI